MEDLASDVACGASSKESDRVEFQSRCLRHLQKDLRHVESCKSVVIIWETIQWRGSYSIRAEIRIRKAIPWKKVMEIAIYCIISSTSYWHISQKMFLTIIPWAENYLSTMWASLVCCIRTPSRLRTPQDYQNECRASSSQAHNAHILRNSSSDSSSPAE